MKVDEKVKYVIWGAGTWGKRLVRCLKIYKHEVVAFIDSNKYGETYDKIPIISLDEYKDKYSQYMIIIAIFSKETAELIKELLNKNNITTYLNMRENPWDLFFQYEGKTFPFDEALEKVKSIIENKIITISSINLFGLFLYDYLKKTNVNVLLIEEENFNNNVQLPEKFKKAYKFISEDKLNDNQYVTLQVNPMIGTNKNMLEFNKGKIPFFEFPYLSDYQNPELSQFKNIYTEKDRCFIVATGPSLKIEDLNLLHEHKEITFSMNKVYKAFHLTSWRPTYYFASDPEMLRVNEKDLVELDVDYKFLSDTYTPFWERNKGLKNLYRFHSIFDYARKNEDDFSEDVTKGMYASMTVAYLALQMAVYMGFKKIYIIGSDCDYYGKDGTDDRTHFVAGYNSDEAKKATKPYVLDVEQIFKSYEAAKCYADKHGIKIYNATRGGKLEVFERVDFDSLF